MLVYLCAPHQSGTSVDDSFFAVAMATDGTVVLAGETEGGWSGKPSGGSDFVAMKLDEQGLELWRWQVALVMFILRNNYRVMGVHDSNIFRGTNQMRCRHLLGYL